MNEFMLTIVTPDNLVFKKKVEKFVVDTINGRIGILANHIDYFTTISLGRCGATIAENNEKVGICNTGILTILNGNVELIATTFEWVEDIDHHRAQKALEKTTELLRGKNLSVEERKRLERKLERAEFRNKYIK